MEKREKKLGTHSYKQETGINIAYGKETWRPVQSVIDLIQNHLDANTTAHEKQLLQLVGVTTYNPSSKDQRQVLSLLSEIKILNKEAPDQKGVEELYSTLTSVLGLNIPSKETLQQQLQELDYPLPQVKLKVVDTTQPQLAPQFVEYDKIKDLSPQWQIVGFRIYDIGSGFDYRLLGMVGASTKKEEKDSRGNKSEDRDLGEKRRGGLGEGLKMSATHLVRSGTTVRLLSRNSDGLWTARPAVEDQALLFKGRMREENGNQITGSITDVDFSDSNFDSKTRDEIVNALDLRKGEGLGKYVLEFRGPQFPSIINLSTEISSLGVPNGRVYVKGLLVEELDNSDDLFWSYNLGEKLAISGRDRKTVKRNILTNIVKEVVGNLENPIQISSLLKALQERRKCLEVQMLNGNLQLGKDQQKLWRQAIEKTFDFILGQRLFASDNLSSDKRRMVEQRGFKIVVISSENMEAIKLFEKLYPGQIVSFTQFERTRGSKEEEQGELFFLNEIDKSEEEKNKSQPLSPEESEVLNKYKNEFILRILKFLEQFEENGFTPFKLEKLQSLKFARADNNTHFELNSSYEYIATKNTLYVKEGAVKADFTTLSEVWAQFLKAATNMNVFGTKSQALLTQMASEALASLEPELLTEFRFSDSKDFTFERQVTYSAEQRAQDDNLVTFSRHLEYINTPNITKEQLEQTLAKARASKPSNYIYIFDKINKLFCFENKLYSINTNSLELEEDQKKRSFRLSDLESQEEGSADYVDILKRISIFKPTEEISELSKDKNTSAELSPPKKFIPKDFLLDGDYFFKPIPELLTHKREVTSGNIGQPEKKLLNPNETSHQLDPQEQYYLPFELGNRESIQILLEEGNKQAQIILKRKNNKIFAIKIADGKSEVLQKERLTSIYSEFVMPRIEIYNNVLLIKVSEKTTMTVDKNQIKNTLQLEETNQGKQFISSNITLNYGEDVWKDPKRILLDAIQNHIDAQGGKLPNILYTVVNLANSNDKIFRVPKEALQNMGGEWAIIGVSITDQGEGYPTEYLTNLGSSTKSYEHIGQFGEGLKMLAASAVNQGIKVEISSRDWVAEPTRYQQTVKNYETGQDIIFDMLGYNLEWQEKLQVGSRTDFSLTPLQPSQEQLTFEEKTELQRVLAKGSKTGEIWQEWAEVLDSRKADETGQTGLDRYVLPKGSCFHTNDVVNLLTEQKGKVYEKGLLVPGGTSQKMIFGYNLEESIINTRERNSFNLKMFEGYLSDYFKNLTDTEVMKKVLQTAKENPNINFYEYKFLVGGFDHNEVTKTLWRQVYYEIFGEDAILSLRPELQKLPREQSSFRLSGIDLYYEKYKNDVISAVVNEVHLENHNLQTLPGSLTEFFLSEVYTSKDFLKKLEAEEIELSHEDKEKLLKFAQTANQAILAILKSIDSDPEKSLYLDSVVSPEYLGPRKEHLQQITTDNIKIKNPAFPAAGMVREENGQAVIYLNQKILSNPQALLDTYVHEVSHYLSGQKDYILDFQRFLMSIALTRSLKA